MRKIEREMLEAIHEGCKDWHKGNTRVHAVVGGMEVQLHGHRIATVDNDGIVWPDPDTWNRWPTNTTGSRLAALGVMNKANGGSGTHWLDERPVFVRKDF